MSSGHGPLFAAIYAAMLLYGASLALMLRGTFPAARVTWTLGCALLWVHVALAMHAVHHWDHADLVRSTAEQTAQVTGLRFGGGVYVNYAFMLAWAADAVYWWCVGHARYARRPLAATAALHAFLLFIAFNGTVVFARPATRWAALMGFALLLLIALNQRLERRRKAAATNRVS